MGAQVTTPTYFGTAMALNPPHILLATSNTRKMLENLRHVLDTDACNAIQNEIDDNVKALFALGEGHFQFAKQTQKTFWRQRISRLYYGAYNVRRAVQLHFSGDYQTDVSDHKKIGLLPDGFPNRLRYKQALVDLRDDRNEADYNHLVDESQLLLTQDDAESLVTDFIKDARNFLNNRGVSV
jgi:hypothetical protein